MHTFLKPGLHVCIGLFLLATRIANGDIWERESVSCYGRNFPFYIDYNFDSVSNYIVYIDEPNTRLYLQYYVSYHCAIDPRPGRGLQSKINVLKLPKGVYAVIQIINILAGDIELNPGPVKRGRKPKYPCTLCSYAVKKGDKGMLCTNCNNWSHNSCTGVTDQSYEHHKENSNAVWFCPSCELMNIVTTDSTFDSYSHCSTNQFSVLDPDTDYDRHTPEPKPVTTSSPKRTLKQKEIRKRQTMNSESNITGSATKPVQKSSDKHPKRLNKNCIKIVIANFQSIRNKVTEFNAFNTVTNPDIILGCESWLDGSITSAEIFPSNLQVIRNDRKNAKGGGVFIALNRTIPKLERPDLTEGDSELSWCQLLMGDGSSIYIGSYYRPPTATKDLDKLSKSLNKIQQETSSPYILLGGDFNIPNMSWTSTETMNPLQQEITDIANEYGLEQIVSFPTRRDTNGTENILDLCFTTHPSLVKDIYPYPGFSDHCVVMVEINSKTPLPTRPPRQIHQWKKMDEDRLKTDAQQFTKRFLNSNPESKTVEENWCDFKNSMHELINIHVPIKSVSGKPRVPWLTSKLQRLCRKKERYYGKAKKFGGQAKWDKYKQIKNEVNKELRKAQRSYIADLSEAGNKQFWKYIKTKRKDNVGIQSLKVDNQTITDDQGKADILANQFHSVFTKDDCQVPNLPPSNFPDMPEIDITTDGITKLLRNLDVSKANGPDMIPNHVLKLTAEQIAPALQFIFKQSYDQGVLPEDWRKANIASVYKKGSKSDPANYRPISLTCVCCKLMEHILDSQLMKHLTINSILTDYQHAFRQGRSCDTQLTATIHDLATNHNDRKTCDIAILDFSKAFDVVPHQKLLQKLHMYGIRNKNLTWIKSFLTFRHQRTLVNGKTSDWLPVLSGIPQGTVLGPHLFILFINDLTDTVNSTARLFADDCILYQTISNPTEEKSFQNDLDNLTSWANTWGMKFNTSKCSVMRISRKRDPGQTNYNILGEQLKEVTSHQYLGIHVEDNLKWTKQTKHAVDKGTRVLNFIRRNFNNCSKTVKKRLYQTLVRPHLEYASIAWHPGTAKNSNMLEMVQRRAARFVMGDYSRESSVTNMIEELGWISLEQRRTNQRLATFHKIIHGNLQLDLDKYASKKKTRLRRSHDQQYDVKSNFITTTQLANSFFPDSISHWNKLPQQIVNIKSTELFKSSLVNMPELQLRRTK